MTKLRNKKILLLAPEFFDYYKVIQEELSRCGVETFVILENFVNRSKLYKFFWIKNKRTKFLYTNSYYFREINKIRDDIDIVLIIRGEAISEEVMQFLKKKYSNACFVMYQWDSVRNNENALMLAQYCDRNYTFDPVDAEQYHWQYRPLFFYESADLCKKRDIDFTFIGTLYYKRAEVLKKLSAFCAENGYTLFDYLYVNKWEYYIHKYLMRDKRYSILDKSQVRFVPLSKAALRDIYSRSKILVDYTAETQSGLTMRTIESIGFSCKLITNSKYVRQTEVFDDNNILVYNLDTFSVPEVFVNTAYREPSKDVKGIYSVSNWLQCVLRD